MEHRKGNTQSFRTWQRPMPEFGPGMQWIRAWIVMVLGDMLGSAELSGIAFYGDHFTMVKGVHSSNGKGEKYQYLGVYPTTSSNCHAMMNKAIGRP